MALVINSYIVLKFFRGKINDRQKLLDKNYHFLKNDLKNLNFHLVQDCFYRKYYKSTLLFILIIIDDLIPIYYLLLLCKAN